MLEDKAKELGRTIGQSAEYQAMRRANEELQGDRDLTMLLKNVERIRIDAQRLIEAGQHPPAQMEQELDTLLTTLQQNPLYQRFLVAQENFDKVMLRVNDWMVEGMRKGGVSSIITLG